MVTATKVCVSCETRKPRDAFPIYRRGSDGNEIRRGVCKGCVNERNKKRYRALAGPPRSPAPQPRRTPVAKRCPSCGLVQEPSAFYRHRGAPDGLTAYCKECSKAKQREKYDSGKQRQWNRASWLRRLYGITLEHYEELLQKQGGVCAICREPCASGKLLAVDHVHETGKIRGLLCRRCNQALGQFGDRIDLLQAAVKYLRSNV